VRKELSAIAKISHKEDRTPLVIRFNDPPPFPGVVHINLPIVFVAASSAARWRSAVQMRINSLKLIVIVLVRMLVAVRVVRIVHAGAEIGVVKILVLVVQPECVTDLTKK